MASKSAPKKTSSTSPRRSIRRQFLRSSASALAVLYVISSSSLGLAGTVAPSERITLGLIGCGIHGAGAGQDEAKHGPGWCINQIFRNDDAQLVAVCDVDQSRVEMAKRKVDEHYAKTLGEANAMLSRLQREPWANDGFCFSLFVSNACLNRSSHHDPCRFN